MAGEIGRSAGERRKMMERVQQRKELPLLTCSFRLKAIQITASQRS
jgi:hypothetical protein